MSPQAEQAIQEAAARQGKTVEELAQEAMIAELRNHRTPQSLDELKPRLALEPGQTLGDVLAAHPWPGDETDEELLAALKAMG